MSFLWLEFVRYPGPRLEFLSKIDKKKKKNFTKLFLCATDSFIFVPLCCFTGETIQNLYSVCKNVSDELEDLFAFYQFLVWNFKTT